MPIMSVTLATFQFPISWLNGVIANNCTMLVTLETSQAIYSSPVPALTVLVLIFWLKPELINMLCISVTLVTSQWAILPLKLIGVLGWPVLESNSPANIKAMSVTEDTFQEFKSWLKAVAP